MRIRHRPRKRRAPQGGRATGGGGRLRRSARAPSEDDLRRRARPARPSTRRMPSRSRSPSSAPTPAPHSPSDRRAESCSSSAADAGVECAEYAPARVKQAVCGYGRADKEQVQKMVKAILGLDELPDAEPCRRRARRRDLPRARASAPAAGGRVIAQLRGPVVHAPPSGLVLDVGGVGYLVAATPSVLRTVARRRADGRTRTSTSARTPCSCTASPSRPSGSCSCSCSP